MTQILLWSIREIALIVQNVPTQPDDVIGKTHQIFKEGTTAVSITWLRIQQPVTGLHHHCFQIQTEPQSPSLSSKF